MARFGVPLVDAKRIAPVHDPDRQRRPHHKPTKTKREVIIHAYSHSNTANTGEVCNSIQRPAAVLFMSTG